MKQYVIQYICVCVCVCGVRERERERERDGMEIKIVKIPGRAVEADDSRSEGPEFDTPQGISFLPHPYA